MQQVIFIFYRNEPELFPADRAQLIVIHILRASKFVKLVLFPCVLLRMKLPNMCTQAPNFLVTQLAKILRRGINS